MYVKSKITIVLMAALALTGCMGTQYKEAPLDEKLGYTITTAQNYIVDPYWWQAYNDANLNQLVDTALANNINLAQSAITMRKAMYQARLSELDLWPGLSSSAGASSSRPIYRHAEFSDNRSFNGELGLSYELDLWGKLRDMADASEWGFKATVLDMETTRLALINSVIDVYYNLVYLHDAVEATQDNLNNLRQVGEIMDAKFAYGKISAMESLQIKQSILTSENNLVNYQTQIRQNEQTLRDLLNLPPDAPLNVSFKDMLAVNILNVDLDVPLAVLAQRPDLQASENRLRQAFKNLEAVEKSWYPTVSLKSSLSSKASDIEDTLDFPVLLGSISISLPFLQWNTVKTNVKISEADYESARLTFEENINTALNEVAYYYVAYENSKVTFDNTLAKHNTDREIVALYESQYQNGKAEFKDLLDSINTANSSRISVLNDKYQVVKNENMIYKAMSGKYKSTESGVQPVTVEAAN